MPCETAVTPETILKDSDRLTPDDCFTFRCGPDLKCFTECCRDVTIVLTPYDLIRLKRALGVDSSELLEKYTIRLQQPGQEFPIVVLKMDEESKQCPFLSTPLPDGRGSVTDGFRERSAGCGIYPDRPWACRMYPLGAAEPKTPAGNDQPFHFVIHEELCKGHGEGSSLSVRDWMTSQRIEEFEMMSAGFKELTLHDHWEGEKSLTPQQADMFYMACYDVDRFRRFVFETRFLQLFDTDEARVEAFRHDDEELLDFAMQWLRFAIFGERSMKMRRGAGARGNSQ
jgi:Fe-S-cluster containining protein